MQALSTLSRSSHKRFAGLYLGPWDLLWERPTPPDTSLYPLPRYLFFYWQLSCSESQPPSENDKLYKCKSQLLYLRLIYFTRVNTKKKISQDMFPIWPANFYFRVGKHILPPPKPRRNTSYGLFSCRYLFIRETVELSLRQFAIPCPISWN